MSGWEADEDDWGMGEEESTDLEDEDSVIPAQPPLSIKPRQQTADTLTRSQALQPSSNKQSGRRTRVKAMPAKMRAKWPNLASCLMTFASGKQVLLVRG